jgi:hypothetical protein
VCGDYARDSDKHPAEGRVEEEEGAVGIVTKDARTMATEIRTHNSMSRRPTKLDENLEVDVPINIDSITPITKSVLAFVPPFSNNHSIAQDRPRRNIALPHRYRDTDSMAHYTLAVAQETNVAFEPSSYSEAISCDNSTKWLVAMNDEFESLQNNSNANCLSFLKVKNL